jgi:hypothetical protein
MVQRIDEAKRRGRAGADAVQLTTPGDLLSSKRGAHVLDNPGNKQQEPIAKKKSYKKPSFRQEKVFETTALGCGKVNSTDTGCNVVRKS